MRPLSCRCRIQAGSRKSARRPGDDVVGSKPMATLTRPFFLTGSKRQGCVISWEVDQDIPLNEKIPSSRNNRRKPRVA